MALQQLIYGHSGIVGVLPSYFQSVFPQPKQLKGLEFDGQVVHMLYRNFLSRENKAIIALTKDYRIDAHVNNDVEVITPEVAITPSRVLRPRARFQEDGKLKAVVPKWNEKVYIEITGPGIGIIYTPGCSVEELDEQASMLNYSHTLWDFFSGLEASVRKFKENKLVQSELEKLARE
jgi:hypothetical protein